MDFSGNETFAGARLAKQQNRRIGRSNLDGRRLDDLPRVRPLEELLGKRGVQRVISDDTRSSGGRVDPVKGQRQAAVEP